MTVSFRRRTVMAALTTLILGASSLSLGPAPAQAAVVTPFTIRYQTNAPGAIVTLGNATTTCSTDPAKYPAGSSIAGNAAKCEAARRSTSMTGPQPPSPMNNSFFMTYLDVDADPTTFSSSTSNLSVPSGAQVAFAGLYWSGYRTKGGDGGVAAPSSADSTTVKLAHDGGDYITINGSYIAQDPGSSKSFSAFADVTSLVQDFESGDYTVANVQSATGSDTYGGWSLVVVYQLASLPMRNLTVFDGWARVANASGDSSVDFSVAGFRTPSSGPVNTQVSLVSFEGDRTSTGDTFSIRGNRQSSFVKVSNAVNPPSDVANSTVSADGVLQNNPGAGQYPNTLGVDVDQFSSTTGLLINSETSATLRVTTSGETWFPNVVTFAVDVFAPKLELTKSQLNVTSPSRDDHPDPGDVLEYSVAVNNTNGQDSALNTTITDQIPAGTTYVPSSASLARGPCAPAGDSGSSVSVVGNGLTAYLGTNATASAGGEIPSGCTGSAYTITFRVTVNPPDIDNQVIPNVAHSFATGRDSGNSFTTSSNEVVAIVGRVADLAVTKTLLPGLPVPGGRASFAIAVRNLGPSSAASPITVTDTLPVGFAFSGVSADNSPGWSCLQDIGNPLLITCELATDLQAGQSAPDLFIQTTLDPTIGGTPSTNTATVSSSTPDLDTSNNSSSVSLTPSDQVDLAIAKLPTSFTAGSSGRYTMVVTNNGPSAYQAGPTVVDTLPAGVSYTGPAPSGWACSAVSNVVTCVSDSTVMAPGGTLTLELPVTISGGTLTSVVNSATVNVGPGDPDPTNNTATSTSDVAVSSDMTITKSTVADIAASDVPVYAGSTMTWYLTVSNVGPSANAGPTQVEDVLPPGMRYVSSTLPTGWACSAASVSATAPQLVSCTRTGGFAVGDIEQLVLTVSVDLATAGAALVNQASVTAPNEACAITPAACTNNSAVHEVTPLRGTVQVVKNITGGNELRTGAVEVSIDCPANAALHPELWPVELSVAIGQMSAGTGLLPVSVADTCTVTETSTGAPAAPTSPGTITPRWAGGAWTSGTRTLVYGKSATLSATSSSGKPVLASVGAPCRLVKGTVAASTGTGSCSLSFTSQGNPTVTSNVAFVGFANAPLDTVALGTVSTSTTTLAVDPTNSALANVGTQIVNAYTATAPVIRTTRTVSLAKAPIPLTVTADPSNSRIDRKGTSEVVSDVQTRGRVSVRVQCRPTTVTQSGDLRYCSFTYNPRTGAVSVTTFGYRNVLVKVTITSTPTGSYLTSRYKASTWTRSWRVA